MSDRQSNSLGPVTENQLAALAGGIGILFVLVAGVDVLLTWLPTNFGNREWEFGTVSASFNGLLSVVFGLALVQAWLSRAEHAWPLRVMGFVQIVLALLVVGAALMYARNVSIAMNAASAGGAGVGIMKAIIKTSFQSVTYPIALLLLARLSFLWAGKIARATANGAKNGPRVGVLRRD